MARVLGYGGLANTAGARSFAGKEEALISPDDPTAFRYWFNRRTRRLLRYLLLLVVS